MSGSRKSVIIIPIREPQSPYLKKDKVRNIGVLRGVNKVITKDGIVKYCTFSWEDICILEYTVEMIGVITFFYKKAQKKDDEFERAIHGLKRGITTIGSHLSLLTERHITALIPDDFRCTIPNSISSIEAFKWQIDKHTKNDDFDNITPKK